MTHQVVGRHMQLLEAALTVLERETLYIHVRGRDSIRLMNVRLR